MKATIPFLQQKFETFNRLLFDGKLPPVPIELSSAKSFLGACVYRKRSNGFGQTERYDFKLRFSTRYDLTEEELEDTLIHEMIHYYIGVNRLSDRSAHGPLFRQLMQHINQQYGRHLTISHRDSPRMAKAENPPKVRWRVVAKVRLRNGSVGLKVLPRVESRILTYYYTLTAQNEVQSVELFLSDHPFFERYPCSAAFKMHPLAESELDRHLQGAERLTCNNYQLLRGQ